MADTMSPPLGMVGTRRSPFPRREADAVRADPEIPVDEFVGQALSVLRSLDRHRQERVVAVMLAAVYEYQSTGDVAMLTTMADDIAFTIRVQGSERYRKLHENGPREPAMAGRPVAAVLADVGM